MINKISSIKIIKYLFVLVLFLFASPIFASTCGVTSTGGNWNSAGTWFNCAGTFPISGDDVVATSTSGNVVLNVNTNVLKSFDFSTYGGTLSGTGTIFVRGLSGSTQDIKFGGTVTWTGVLDIRSTSGTALIRLTTNGRLMTAITNANGSAATTTLMDDLSFTAAKTDTLTIASPFDMNGFNISGNSVTNRLLIQSNTFGTQRQITPNGGTFANADFRDMSTNVSTNLSSITGNSGDCGGNSNITFTASTTQTWSGTSSDSWSTNAWTSRVPLCQDDVVIASAFTPAGRVITVDMPRIGANVDFTGTTGTPTLTFTSGMTSVLYGSLTLVPTMSIANINTIVEFSGRGTYTLTSAGLQIPQSISVRTGSSNSLSLQGTLNTLRGFTVNSGIFNTNDYDMTIGSAFSLPSNANTTFNAGSSTITMTGTGGVVNIQTNGTFNAGTSNFVVSNTTTFSKTFSVTGNRAFYTGTFSGDNITFVGFTGGVVSFNTLAVNNAGYGGTNGLIFATGVGTTTINNLTTNATTTSDRAKIRSATSGTLAGLQANTGANICVDYMQIKDIRAYGTSAFYAGTNSLDVSGNTGWIFSGCPNTATPISRSNKTIFQKFKSIIMGRFIIR